VKWGIVVKSCLVCRGLGGHINEKFCNSVGPTVGSAEQSFHRRKENRREGVQ